MANNNYIDAARLVVGEYWGPALKCEACGMEYVECFGRLVPNGFLLYDSVHNRDVPDLEHCPRGLRCPGYDWEYGQQRLFYDIDDSWLTSEGAFDEPF